MRGRIGSERGAIVIQVAFALLALTALSAFVVDYGIMLASHNEAQNVVDSAALAAATALAYDGYEPPDNRTRAYDTAQTVATKNYIEGETPAVDIDATVFCGVTADDPPNTKPAQACVQVTAYRDAAHNNAMPAFFARLMGTTSLDATARAIAQARVGDATKCLRPLAIPDRWLEGAPPWTAASTFDPAAGDVYKPADLAATNSSLTLSEMYGVKVTLTEGELKTPASIKPWTYLPISIPGSLFGADALRANTDDCPRATVLFADRLNLVAGDVHTSALEIAAGAADLIEKDRDAVWNEASGRVENSCAQLLIDRCASLSPRIIAVALYDPDDLFSDSAAALPDAVSVNNIMGFFIDSVTGTSITGYITTHPGLRDPNTLPLHDNASFLRAPMLVQ